MPPGRSAPVSYTHLDVYKRQVEGIQSGGVAACIKHFACNNADYKRTWIDSVVEPRALHEISLAGFERAVRKARPCAVMGAYNKVNGVQACERCV